ncbi:hypothetical protein Tco_0951715 [Tanacetum coccineum]|uniref:Uncharacterized protein n=1 Tax=Tanacetum coccineum TaxID=301880 RepID=A0ABQ5DVA3_9ASTR
MRTRSQARRRRQPQVRQTSVESSNLEKPDNPPIVTMADNRTMAQSVLKNHRGSRNPNPEPNVAPVVAPVVTPIPKASIPFPSRR